MLFIKKRMTLNWREFGQNILYVLFLVICINILNYFRVNENMTLVCILVLTYFYPRFTKKIKKTAEPTAGEK